MGVMGEFDGVLGEVTQLVNEILDGSKSGIDDFKDEKPASCAGSKDKCCIWYDVSAELTKLFVGEDQQCNDNARGAVRMGFHDAGSWEKGSTFGGADGSFLMNFGEQNRKENNGLQNARKVLRGVQAKYKVGYADLVQYAHNHATISCPKGPRVRTFIGRKDATKANAVGLLPDTHDSPDNLLAMFERKGFSARDLAALVGAHATARQRFVDESASGKDKFLDTTPGVWDVEFYNDTLNNAAGATQDQTVFVLPSDKALSTHPSVSASWRLFVGNQIGWNIDYARAYMRMSMLGVSKDTMDKMVDCTKTLPATRPFFP